MSSSPIAIPKDFFKKWAKQPENGDDVKDPFATPTTGSRVTASGFTNSTIKSPRHRYVPPTISEEDSDFSSSPDRKYSRESQKDGSWKTRDKEFWDNERKIQKDMKGLVSLVGNMVSEMNIEQKAHDDLQPEEIQDLRMVGKGKNVVEPESKQIQETAWEKENKERYVTLDDFKAFASRIEQSVHPRDSASVFTPVDRPTQLQPYRVETEVNFGSKAPSALVVGGYLQTTEEKFEELDSHASVMPISGLPIVFTNERLNFLSHLHTALLKLLTDSDGNYPAIDSMDRILDNKRIWNTDPANMLLGMVLDKTIDFRKANVKSNPFDLPILEPTMVLTEKIVHMCFDQLNREFEKEWFNTFKTVTVPAFSSKYESQKYKNRKYSSSSSGTERKSRSSSGSTSSRRSSGGSVISKSGFLGFR